MVAIVVSVMAVMAATAAAAAAATATAMTVVRGRTPSELLGELLEAETALARLWGGGGAGRTLETATHGGWGLQTRRRHAHGTKKKERVQTHKENKMEKKRMKFGVL